MQAPTHTPTPTPTLTHATIEAVLRTLLDPHADFLDAAQSLRLTLVEFLAIAESPPVLQAIESLERLADLRARALLAKSAHTAIAALERIAGSLPETPSATETVRKAAAQLLRMAAKATVPVPVPAPCATGGSPAHAADVQEPSSESPPRPLCLADSLSRSPSESSRPGEGDAQRPQSTAPHQREHSAPADRFRRPRPPHHPSPA